MSRQKQICFTEELMDKRKNKIWGFSAADCLMICLLVRLFDQDMFTNISMRVWTLDVFCFFFFLMYGIDASFIMDLHKLYDLRVSGVLYCIHKANELEVYTVLMFIIYNIYILSFIIFQYESFSDRPTFSSFLRLHRWYPLAGGLDVQHLCDLFGRSTWLL